MLNLALPLLTVAVPKVAVPSLKITVPVAPDGVMVAVNVTDTPSPEGFADEDTAVVVLALFTVCDSAEELLLLQFESPAYEPVIECDPAVRAVVV